MTPNRKESMSQDNEWHQIYNCIIESLIGWNFDRIFQQNSFFANENPKHTYSQDRNGKRHKSTVKYSNK